MALLLALATAPTPPLAAHHHLRMAAPVMVQDKFSGGAVPFAPIGTAGDGSTASVASMSGMSGHVPTSRHGLPGRGRVPLNGRDAREQRAVLEGTPQSRARRRAAEAAGAAGLTRTIAATGGYGRLGAVGGTMARRPAPQAAAIQPATAAPSGEVDLELRQMIQTTTADKKAAAQSRYDALVAEQESLIAAFAEEREVAKAELEQELARIDEQAEAAMALAMQ